MYMYTLSKLIPSTLYMLYMCARTYIHSLQLIERFFKPSSKFEKKFALSVKLTLPPKKLRRLTYKTPPTKHRPLVLLRCHGNRLDDLTGLNPR